MFLIKQFSTKVYKQCLKSVTFDKNRILKKMNSLVNTSQCV